MPSNSTPNQALPFIVEEQQTIRGRPYSVVREYILSGRFSPGDRVIETRLARELAVSRKPVREALDMLVRDGILESIPKVGHQLRSLTIAWAADNIRVNALVPGFINTDLSAEGKRDIPALEEIVTARTPMGRWGEPEDCAGTPIWS